MIERRIVTNFGAVAIGVIALALSLTVPSSATAQSRSRKVAGARSVKAVKGSKRIQRRDDKDRDKEKTLARAGRPGDEIKGVRMISEPGVSRSMDEINQAQLIAPPSKRPPLAPEKEAESVIEERQQNPNAPMVASYPSMGMAKAAVVTKGEASPLIAQTVGANFTGPTLSDTGAFPPDSMGAVGPTQYFVFVNGRMRTYSKATGLADGAVNADPDVFFSSVITPVGTGVALSFTSDPQVRYDRLTGRWIISIIDVPCSTSSCTSTPANRWLVAVSDAASSTITNSTVWTFFWVKTDTANFCDYPSLGVDNLALYFGCNMFTPAGSFVGTNAYVVKKSSVMGAGPMVTTAFPNVSTASADGPYAPRGVDNYDPNSTEGYFVGVSTQVYSELVVRRISNPGGGSDDLGQSLIDSADNRNQHSGGTLRQHPRQQRPSRFAR